MYEKSKKFSLAGSPAKLSIPIIFVPQRAKKCPTMTKISRGQDT